jgi:hypothetical protein
MEIDLLAIELQGLQIPDCRVVIIRHVIGRVLSSGYPPRDFHHVIGRCCLFCFSAGCQKNKNA